MINSGNVEKCQCGNNTFHIVIDNEYHMLLFQCEKCGYVDTNWFNEPDSE